MKNSLTISSAVLASFFAVAAASALQAAETKFKLVTMLPAKHPVGKSFGKFIDGLNASLKGEFQLDWRGSSEVVPQFKQPNAVRLGSVDATLTSPSYVNGILNVSGSANYSDKPYADTKAAGYHDYMASLHTAKGLVYIGELPVPNMKFHIFLKDPIKEVGDLKNMKIRVFPAIAPAIKALGANPVVLPMPAIYTSMERGVVKGFVTGVPGVAAKFAGVVGAYIDEGFYRATFHFLANPKAWSQVPANTRAKVVDFVRNVNPPKFAAAWQPGLDASYAAFKKDKIPAVRFSPEVTAKFKKTVYEAAWNAVKKNAPKEGATLQKMLMK
jgi:TRAP-type C4-dicarboxylate transport system substrate-binding protein